MSNKVTAILTSAGTGSRFKNHSGSSLPKQFIPIFKKPAILYSLEAFQQCSFIFEIIISAKPDDFNLISKIIEKNKITKPVKIIEGGKTRFLSVKNAFFNADSNADFVLIHDAVRPNINKLTLDNIISKTKKTGVTYGTKIYETVKRSKGRFQAQTVTRDNLWLIKTPQVFPFDMLYNSYKKFKSSESHHHLFTDESSMVEEAGYKVKIIECSTDNIKITTSEDLAILKKLMKE